MRRFKVYIRKLTPRVSKLTAPLSVRAHNHSEAKTSIKKMMKQRFNRILNRDYEITKTVEVKK